jgi:hypothetical protein
MIWFFDLNGDEVVEYLVFSLLEVNTLSTNLMLILVLEVFYLSPRMLSKRLWPR